MTLSKSETDRLLEIERKYKKSTERSKYYSRKRNARLVIMYNRALENNIPIPTDEEIIEYMNRSK